MSYQCGIGEGMRTLGIPPREPRFICDGCGTVRLISAVNGVAPAWFLKYRPPPGWRGLRKHDGSQRWDLCPTC